MPKLPPIKELALVPDELGEMTDCIVVDVSQIPSCRVEELVAPLLDNVIAFFQQPGVEEKFQEWRRQRAQKQHN